MPIVSPTKLIGARSPIYITANYGSLAFSMTDVTLEVYIWTGARGSRPASPQYTLFRDVFASTDLSFDIAAMVEEYLTNSYSGFDIIDVGNVPEGSVVWVQIDYTVNYINKAIPPQTVNDTGSSAIFEASNGYHLFTEGANKQHSTGFLHNTSRIYVTDAGNEIVAAYPGEYGSGYNDLTFVRVIGDSQYEVDFDITSDLINTQAEGRILTFPCGITNVTEWLDTVGEPLLYTKYYSIQLLQSDETILDSIDIYPTCESKYTPAVIRYINRYGVWEPIYFFKRSDDNMQTTSEQYRRSIGTSGASGFTYDTTEELYKNFNTNGKITTTLNTGWVNEEYKEAIKDLLMSERVMLDGKPVNVISESVTLQKAINDKTINYTIQVEEAFDIRYV